MQVDDPKAKKGIFLRFYHFCSSFATIIHAFVTQPFAIPTGSMERTLLVGDFIRKQMELWLQNANETSCAILQGTIMDTQKDGNPKNDPKSYVDAIKLPYFRIGEFKNLRKNDIVVFNYPEILFIQR